MIAPLDINRSIPVRDGLTTAIIVDQQRNPRLRSRTRDGRSGTTCHTTQAIPRTAAPTGTATPQTVLSPAARHERR
ncbi:hypothetical protein ACWEPL_65160 [Nonomuraea sp. NPDC004186]